MSVPHGLPVHNHAEIRRRRLAAGLTRRELAARSEISPQHMSLIENGSRNPSAAVLVKLARALGCPSIHLVAEQQPDQVVAQ